jgi:hypothetical protein
MASFNISKASAVNMAKWRVQLKLNAPGLGIVEKMGLNAALSGGIEKIFDEVYDLGFSISARDDNQDHMQWLQAGSIVKE